MTKPSYMCGMTSAVHFVFGSALVGWANHHVTDNIWWCLAVATIALVIWETWRLRFRRATMTDFVSDITYWFSGALVWALLIEYSKVDSIGVMYPTFILCVWVLEYKRLSANK